MEPIYDGVAVRGGERLQALAKDNTLVYVPCHRSHIDYLLLSYVVYRVGLTVPHIAAGANLNPPLVGGILRRGGAFFLSPLDQGRRTVRRGLPPTCTGAAARLPDGVFRRGDAHAPAACCHRRLA